MPAQNRAVERLRDAMLLEVELGKVGDQPLRAWMVLARGGDQLGIGVDPDDLVASLMEQGAHPTGATAGIEDARPRRKHGVQQSRLAAQVDAFGRHRAESLDVPLGVVLVGVGDPARRTCHGQG